MRVINKLSLICLSTITLSLFQPFINFQLNHVVQAKSKHNKSKNLPKGKIRYIDDTSFGYGSKSFATPNATDNIHIPNGFPFYFVNGKIKMKNTFNNKFTKISYKINKFHPRTSDVKEKVNINHISNRQQKDISQYSANLINNVRHKISNNQSYTADLSVSSRAMNMAKDIAEKYNDDKWNIGTKDGHDVKAINEVAKKYRLRFSNDYSTSDDQQYYEDASGSSLNSKVSMANIKQNVYEAICAMLFDDKHSDWGHTKNLLSSDDLNEKSEEFGVSIDTLDQIHFETIPFSYTNEYYMQQEQRQQEEQEQQQQNEKDQQEQRQQEQQQQNELDQQEQQQEQEEQQQQNEKDQRNVDKLFNEENNSSQSTVESNGNGTYTIYDDNTPNGRTVSM